MHKPVLAYIQNRAEDRVGVKDKLEALMAIECEMCEK